MLSRIETVHHVKMWAMNIIGRPLLYSYRRCPYAMRARMALYAAGIDFDIEEISLRDKPAHMLEVSPKGTVPVLCLPEGNVLEESLDIMRWALNANDPQQWLDGLKDPVAQDLLARNDGDFKKALDAYKYASRFPEISASQMRDQAMAILINPLAEILRSGLFIGVCQARPAGCCDFSICATVFWRRFQLVL